MLECSNCGNWCVDELWTTTGICKIDGEFTARGYSCPLHQPKSAKPPVEPRTPIIMRRQAEIEDALVRAMKEFDAAKAADRVLKSGITIDIITVQGFLRCSYGKAAAVIELLKEQGLIK